MSYNTTVSGTAYSVYEAATSQTGKTQSSYGKTIGNPTLSDTAASYYEQLKAKYSDMEFILVSDDMKDQADANAAAYANSSKTVVLINESKIEAMATDEDVREKYESILSGAKSQLSQIAQSILNSGAQVQGFGIKIDDGGTATLFAVLKKSTQSQKAMMEKKAAKKKAEKKAEEKKTAKKKEEERLKEKTLEKRESDTVVITASSVEELLQKIEDYSYEERTNQVQTEQERAVGQNIDFKG